MENIIAAGNGSLVDIRDVTVDKELSREERIAEFVRQIKNPYRFKWDVLLSKPALPTAEPPWRNVSRVFCGEAKIFQKEADFPVRAWYNKSRKRN